MSTGRGFEVVEESSRQLSKGELSRLIFPFLLSHQETKAHLFCLKKSPATAPQHWHRSSKLGALDNGNIRERQAVEVVKMKRVVEARSGDYQVRGTRLGYTPQGCVCAAPLCLVAEGA